MQINTAKHDHFCPTCEREYACDGECATNEQGEYTSRNYKLECEYCAADGGRDLCCSTEDYL